MANKNRTIQSGKTIFLAFTFFWLLALMLLPVEGRAVSIKPGDLIRGPDGVKIYIVNGKGYKRHVFNPDVFYMYGHLKPENIHEVSQNTLNSYETSDLYRPVGKEKVYKLKEIDEAAGKAKKRWLNMSAREFVDAGYSWDQVFVVSQQEANYYDTGAPIVAEDSTQDDSDDDTDDIEAGLREYGPFSAVPYLSLSGDNFGFPYEQNGQIYLNINDKKYGPYETAHLAFLSGSNKGFLYQKGYNEYVKINNETYGPFDFIAPPSFSEGSFGFYYRDGGPWYANVNNETYGPYSDVYDLVVSENNFGVYYLKDAQQYVRIGDNVFGPYDLIRSISVTKDGFGFAYEKEGSWFFNINGEIYGPYDSVNGGSLSLRMADGNFGFYYKKNGHSYTNINGEI